MREYFTPGIVIDREPKNELDEVVTVYTKEFGKVSAFAKSTRKITSKLSGHLVPGKLAKFRFVEKNKLQLVDVLASSPPLLAERTDKVSSSNLREFLTFLNFLNRVTPTRDADLGLWHMVEAIVSEGRFNPSVYRALLERLGFGGEGRCQYCESRQATHFNLAEMVFLCSQCLRKLNLRSDEIIFLGKS